MLESVNLWSFVYHKKSKIILVISQYFTFDFNSYSESPLKKYLGLGFIILVALNVSNFRELLQMKSAKQYCIDN